MGLLFFGFCILPWETNCTHTVNMCKLGMKPDNLMLPSKEGVARLGILYIGLFTI